MFLPQSRGLSLAVVFLALASAVKPACAQPPVAVLSAPQIVEQMQAHDQQRSRDLKTYHSTRHYKVEYHGFPEDLEATMVAELTFDAASGKSFRILSHTGSNFLFEKVLKRAVDSEQEASHSKESTALTPANYKFDLAGKETLGSGLAYILQVEPLHPSKFLYTGKIWVDAADFAVVKMETHPAKNPSFWISRTLIETTSTRTDGFWFPQKLRSGTKVRIGGEAVLSIDYGSYQVNSNTRSAPAN
jgi:hypothetical protein